MPGGLSRFIPADVQSNVIIRIQTPRGRHYTPGIVRQHRMLPGQICLAEPAGPYPPLPHHWICEFGSTGLPRRVTPTKEST
jgi:hypothetical protein